MIVYQHSGFIVEITREDGSSFIASGENSSAFFTRRRDVATKFKRDLMPHIPTARAKVLPVRITIETKSC